MKCPACLSNEIVWDIRAGVVVCANCGLVIENIYYGYDIPLSTIHHQTMELKHYSSHVGELRLKVDQVKVQKVLELIDTIKKKPYLKLDTQAVEEFLIGKRPPIKLLKRRKVDLKPLSERKYIDFIIDRIIDKDPILASRTERAKVALALIIKDLIIHGSVRRSYISKVTGLSKTHIHRLINLVKSRRIIEHIKKSDEVIDVVSKISQCL